MKYGFQEIPVLNLKVDGPSSSLAMTISAIIEILPLLPENGICRPKEVKYLSGEKSVITGFPSC